jgi:hypothetical protein
VTFDSNIQVCLSPSHSARLGREGSWVVVRIILILGIGELMEMAELEAYGAGLCRKITVPAIGQTLDEWKDKVRTYSGYYPR